MAATQDRLSCFAAGTKVSTPNGDRAIESLKVGDVVWSKPEKGGKPFAAKILATHQRSDQPIYRLKLKSVRADGIAAGETLLVTPSHPFYVPAKRDFIPVIELKPGDLLQSLADGDSENTSSEVESLELYLPLGKTYNLTVDVGHTFYVGKLKTWVHNTGPCDLSPDYLETKDVGGRADPLASGAVDVTKRPSGFRKQTVQDSWDNATTGSAPGTKACPTCSKDVGVAPGQGRRDWDVDHQPPWSQRDLSGKTRSQVLDEYNESTRLECPSCNRSRGARPAD